MKGHRALGALIAVLLAGSVLPFIPTKRPPARRADPLSYSDDLRRRASAAKAIHPKYLNSHARRRLAEQGE